MVSITENITRYLDIAEMTYRIPRRWIAAIVIFPIFIDLVALILLRIEATRYAARWMLAENHPAELLTFLFLMIAAGAALEISRQAMRTQENVWVYGFYLMFGVGLFLIAMEEISWGQQFLKFETFGVFKEINMQHEVNIHNIGALQGNSAYFRIIYGFGGVIGVLLATLNIWRKITPSRMLISWFLVITFFAALGIYKNLSGDTRLYYAFSLRSLSELNEMLIALSALLFTWLNMRKHQFAGRVKSAATIAGVQHH